MSLISLDNFFNDFNVAQKSESSVTSKLQEYIDMYEPEYIEGALGEDFAVLFNASSTPSRFDPLEEMLKKEPSPIAGYVFYHYLRSEAIVATGSGDARLKSENASRSPESFRLRIAWNIMVERTIKIQNYLIKNKVTFPEFNLCYTNFELRKKVNDFGL